MHAADREILRQFSSAHTDPGRVVLEGFHPARHALRFGARLDLAVTYDRDKLLAIADRLAPDVVPAVAGGLEVVDRALFDKLSPRSLSSPLISLTRRPTIDVAAVLADRRRPIVFLETPRNPGNVGAVIRVAAAADVAGVLVSGQVDPWSPVVVRSAAGLQFALDVASADLPSSTDRPIVAVDAGGEPLRPSSLEPGSILLVGGERYGLSPAARALARRSVSIPMRAGVSSLNLATAV
ncbi:MAG TPA: TrmH family RNA methyltransferase, partial [Acidimicrobiales bacterium]|nr:TrmH family RNA methyltransferase [Acidimicrobiales bacterium]